MGSSSFPKAAFALLAMTFFEAGAFAAYLVLNPTYWKEAIGVSEKTSDDANFSYGFLLNFTPLLTAFLADNYLGRYYVLMIHSIVFVIGFIAISFSTVITFPFSGIFGALSMLCVSTAVGINKVILPTFSADQLEGHGENVRKRMFSWYYMLCNLGGILSMQFVANLKDYFTCFGKPCYLFVFSMCTAMILMSTGLFIGFSRCFVRAPLTKNVLVEAVKCLMVAGKRHFRKTGVKEESECEKKSFLDSAIPVYGEKFVGDLKQSLKVASLFFIGIPYWTCYQTMFGSWSRQFSLVDGRIGNYTATFVNFMMVDPITVVISIFLQNTVIIPQLNKVTKVTPLKKMIVGAIAAVLAFSCVVAVEYKIQDDSLSPLRTGAQIAVWRQSSLSNDCRLSLKQDDTVIYSVVETKQFYDIYPGNYEAEYDCSSFKNASNQEFTVQIQNGLNLISIYPNGENSVAIQQSLIPAERLPSGKTEVNLISCRDSINYQNRENTSVYNKYEPTVFTFNSAGFQGIQETLKYPNCRGPNCEFTVDLRGKPGARLLHFDDYNCFNGQHSDTDEATITAVTGYKLSGLWMCPQIFFFALSESLLAVGALEFAYTQTSGSMKAFMQALWLCTAAMGNVLGFFLNQMRMAPLMSHYVNLGIMCVFTMLFIVSSYGYKYIEIEEEKSEESSET